MNADKIIERGNSLANEGIISKECAIAMKAALDSDVVRASLLSKARLCIAFSLLLDAVEQERAISDAATDCSDEGIIIEHKGKRYVADPDDVDHALDIGVDETGAELVATKHRVGDIVVQLKELE